MVSHSRNVLFQIICLLGSAIFTGAFSLFLIKKFHFKSWYKNDIKPVQKPLTWKANFFGGIIFGLGWAFTGVCSAPLFILIGVKWNLGLILLFGALIGTYFYAKVKIKIPH